MPSHSSAFPAHPIPRAAWRPIAWRLLTLAVAAPALAGCGGDRSDKFPPPCPQTVINGDAADLHRFRGAGQDITDNILSGRIVGLNGQCTRTTTTTTTVTMAVSLELTRGPAATGPTSDVAYFVAVSLGDRIIDKRIFRFRPDFPSNTDRLRLTGEPLELALPVSNDRTAAAYKVQVGFQLTPQELAINRARGTQ